MTPETRAARDRIAAYLDARTHILGDRDQIAEAKNGGSPWARLTVTDLRTVLAALDTKPAAIIQCDHVLTEQEADDLKRRFLAAQHDGTPIRVLDGPRHPTPDGRCPDDGTQLYDIIAAYHCPT